MRAKKLTVEQRNKLLASMTDEVAELVLNDNYRQNQALSLMERMAVKRLGSKQHFILPWNSRACLIARSSSCRPMPSSRSARRAARPDPSGCCRAAVLLKLVAFAQLLDSDIPEDPYLSKELQRYFRPRCRRSMPTQWSVTA